MKKGKARSGKIQKKKKVKARLYRAVFAGQEEGGVVLGGR
jgi:hypothetical protein